MWQILRTAISFGSKGLLRKSKIKLLPACTYIIGGGIVSYYIYKKCFVLNVFPSASCYKNTGEIKRAVKLTSRERRFIRFASVEYDGQIYMTPQDFLDSVVEEELRPWRKCRVLTTENLDDIKNNTPSHRSGCLRLFGNLKDKGIVSYSEYLFLLSVLMKPESSFGIAFSVFDTDGDQNIDKNEFLLIERIFSATWKCKRLIAEPNMQSILDHYVDDEHGLQRRHIVDTTLNNHFFGVSGDDKLGYQGFKNFMKNLQTEVLELEFSKYSKGLPTISETDFARILLRYSHVDADKGKCLHRLKDRIQDAKGITFEEFYIFSQFLNNLKDFGLAIRMYTLVNKPISEDEFHHAVKICTGTTLSDHVVHTVFAIFDEDGDGLLSYSEFIAVMQDRLHRGFKSYGKNEGWQAFKVCLKQEKKSRA